MVIIVHVHCNLKKLIVTAHQCSCLPLAAAVVLNFYTLYCMYPNLFHLKKNFNSVSLFSYDVCITFSGDYDAVVTDVDSFKDSVRDSLVSRYGSTHNLKKSQISDVKVSRGSIVVMVTLEDSKELKQSANVTILLIQMEQDVSDIKWQGITSTIVSLSVCILFFCSSTHHHC